VLPATMSELGRGVGVVGGHGKAWSRLWVSSLEVPLREATSCGVVPRILVCLLTQKEMGGGGTWPRPEQEMGGSATGPRPVWQCDKATTMETTLGFAGVIHRCTIISVSYCSHHPLSSSPRAAVTRVNSENVLDEGLRIGGRGRRMNSKVKDQTN
jgi:hypothetical protein